MVRTSYLRFTQPCPTCGRRVQVRASLMGCTVACQHCHAEFVANPNQEKTTKILADANLMERVERAINMNETTFPATN